MPFWRNRESPDKVGVNASREVRFVHPGYVTVGKAVIRVFRAIKKRGCAWQRSLTGLVTRNFWPGESVRQLLADRCNLFLCQGALPIRAMCPLSHSQEWLCHTEQREPGFPVKSTGTQRSRKPGHYKRAGQAPPLQKTKAHIPRTPTEAVC